MNKLPYIHSPKNAYDLLNNYILALIPLLIFGFYKNGILLYQNNLINLKSLFIPLYFYFISIIVAIAITYFTKENFKENLLICLLCSASISLNTNMIIYPILLFVLLFIIKFLNTRKNIFFNSTALIRMFLILALLLNSYSYLNIGEILNKFNYNAFDNFLGFNIGGIATSSLFLVIISFIILSFNKYYKKEVAIFASLSFILTSLVCFFIIKNNSNLSLLLNGTVYFSFIFVGADFKITPYSKKGMILYGIIIGISASLLSLVLNFNEVGYISIFIASLIIPLINTLNNKKYLHQ